MTLPGPISQCQHRPGATPHDVSAAEAALGEKLPSDYRRLLDETSGFEGFIDDQQQVFVSFWPAADIGDLNEAYCVRELVPGAVLLGTDGGDTGYGFIRRNDACTYIAVPLIGMEPDEVESLGKSFDELLARLAA